MTARHRAILRLLPALLAGAVMAAPSGLSAAQAPDYTIVPGERVGPIRLGMNEMELLSAVGMPDEMLKQGMDTLYSWGTLTARIGSASAVVDEITLNDPRYQTADRIHVGMAEFAVVTILGPPTKKATAAGLSTLDFAGIEILDRNNAVMQIRVRK